MEKFAERLRELREEKYLSARKLGALTGIHPLAIQRWEKGQLIPGADKIIILSKFFKVSADYLLGLEDY